MAELEADLRRQQLHQTVYELHGHGVELAFHAGHLKAKVSIEGPRYGARSERSVVPSPETGNLYGYVFKDVVQIAHARNSINFSPLKCQVPLDLGQNQIHPKIHESLFLGSHAVGQREEVGTFCGESSDFAVEKQRLLRGTHFSDVDDRANLGESLRIWMISEE